jgi:hypothetical protein
VRVRLALQGLGLDDKAVYKPASLNKVWALRKTTQEFADPIPQAVAMGEAALAGRESAETAQTHTDGQTKERWVWEYVGKDGSAAPLQRTMVEDMPGRYEQELLRLVGGTPNVYEFAETVKVEGF